MLVSHTPQLIKMPVSSIAFGDTLVRQKARFKRLTHE